MTIVVLDMIWSAVYSLSDLMICFDSELFPQNFVGSSIMIKKASIYTMNALKKSSELWHSSIVYQRTAGPLGPVLKIF